MLDSPFDLLTLAIAIVAFIVALKAMNQVAALPLQLRFWKMSESMGNHDSEVVDASSVD